MWNDGFILDFKKPSPMGIELVVETWDVLVDQNLT